LVNFLTLFGFDLFRGINEIIQPFSLAIVIFTPIFSIYGTGILFFYLFQRYLSRIQNRVFQSFQVQDITRNSGEILHVALLLSLGLMVSFGPIIASDMVKIHDQQQIQAYYGAEYSTGFIYGPGNYLEIKTKLDALDNLDWSVVVESEGRINLLNGPISYVKIFVASDNFFQMLMPEVESYTKIQDEFESSPKNAFIQKSCLNKEFYKRNKKSFDNFYLSLGYSYDEKDLSNRDIFVNAGTFDIIPGAYIGDYGYVPPLGNPLHSYRYSRFDITIFTHLTDKFQNISFGSDYPEKLINFIFEFSKISDLQRNKTIQKVENILGVPIKDNYEEIKKTYGNQIEVTILVNLFSIIGMFNLLLVSIFLLVFIQSFLQKRKGELGVIRARGGTKITVYKLIASEMLIIILGGIIWSFSHVFLYSSSIVNGMIRNNLFPPGFFISIESIFFLLVILIILNLIGLIRPLLLFKQKVLEMIQRRP